MSTKLSPALKSLLSLPRSIPTATPAPPLPTLHRLFDEIRQKAPKDLDPKVWLTVGTAGLCTVNSPEALGGLWEYARGSAQKADGNGSGKGNGVWEAGVMREVGLKCISFNGIPRTINCLGALRSHLPDDVKAALDTKAYRQPNPENINDILARSRSLWDSIYAPHHEKLISKLSDSHPDLPVHILSSHYGPALADPPNLPSSTSIGRILTSLVAITCLRAQRGVGPQVTSHVFGLKKALLERDSAGAGGEGDGLFDDVGGSQVGEWLCGDEGATWVLESADRIGEVVTRGRTSFAGPPEEDGSSDSVKAKL